MYIYKYNKYIYNRCIYNRCIYNKGGNRQTDRERKE